MKPLDNVIVDLLKEFSDSAVDRGKVGLEYRQYWKQRIVAILENAGKQRNFEVYSSVGTEGNWGIDVAWVKSDQGIMVHTPLLAMIDWRGTPHVDVRFRTLIGARARLRVCIMSAVFPGEPGGYAKSWAQQRIEGLQRQASCYENWEHTDKYLFCVWCRDLGGHEWHIE